MELSSSIVVSLLTQCQVYNTKFSFLSFQEDIPQLTTVSFITQIIAVNGPIALLVLWIALRLV